MMAKDYKPFIERQQARHFKLGVSVWSRMMPRCLTSTDYFCDSGYELEVFKFLMLLLNFTVEIKYSTIPGCGQIRENGTYDGLLGMLQRKEIDVIGNLCQVDDTRSNISWLKYSWPVIQQKQTFLIKAPILDHSFKIMAPFSIPVWILYAAVFGVFFCLFAITYKLFINQTIVRSFAAAFLDMYKILLGFDIDIIKQHWFYCICFVGYVQVLYSTLVTTVVLKPANIKRPFHDHYDLADALTAKKYRVLDYTNDAYINCYTPEVCDKIRASFETNEVFLFNSTSLDNVNATNELLQLLVDHSNLVLVKGRHTLMTYLDKFPQRSKLWLIEDRDAGVTWFSYFFRNNFELSNMFNIALIMMGESKDNIYGWYSKLSGHAVQSKKITGKWSERSKLTFHMLRGNFYNYCAAIAVSIFAFLIELIIFYVQSTGLLHKNK